MIFWKDNKAGFVGGSKRLIKGVFQYIHSVTTGTVIVSPDCFAAFKGIITDSDGFQGLIDDSTNAFIGLIDDDPTARIGTVFPNKGFNGIIDPDDLGFEGSITDAIGFEGQLCDC